MDRSNRLILVTGATGYVGGRLVPRLLEAGYRVRCMAREPERLRGRLWPGAELVQGDALDPESLYQALHGVSDAFYLIHSMAAGEEFFERDLRASAAFRDVAAQCMVSRIIYLGGLAQLTAALSPHLKSRIETGEVLRAGPVQVTELRASIIVGSGSVSFELIRYLCERLPVMIAPQWLNTVCQPIGIRAVLQYLIACLETPESVGKIIEVGGPDVLSYREMMLAYSAERGLRRRIFIFPGLTPRISSFWLGMVTPIPKAIARQLIEGLRNESICHDHSALALFPDIHPLHYRESVALALERLQSDRVETSWSGALSSSPVDIAPGVTLKDEEGMFREERRLIVNADPGRVFAVVSRIGGSEGWFYGHILWEIRGLMDRLAGGVGLRRGRLHDSYLRVGDALDFWRVETVEPPNLLLLRAEMRVPGRAWLQFTIEPLPGGGCLLAQKALFAPRGIPGILYWYGLYPIHGLMFMGMVRAIARRAEAPGAL